MVACSLWASVASAQVDYTSAEQEDYSSDERVSISPGQPLQTPDRYQVREGDTLWNISERFLGSPDAWPKVWSYNPEVSNPHWIYPNYLLRLNPNAPAAGAANADPSSAAGAAALQGNNFHGRTVARGAFAQRAKRGSVLLQHEGFLDKDALKERGDVAGSPAEQMMLAPHDAIYLRFRNKVPKPGTEVTLFRPIPVKSLDEHSDGIVVRISGTALLGAYDPQKKLARAVITTAIEPIERGFAVAPMVRRYEMVEPVKNTKSLSARVVSSIYPLHNYSNYQLVFANAGSKAGVAVGNRFVVVRRGDPWREGLGSATEESLGALRPTPAPTKGYPKESVAELIVVAVRPQSSTCMVTQSRFPVVSGDIIELRQGY